jgi:hypothetical protein
MYGVVCIELRAEILAESVEMALVCAEALAGGGSLRKCVQREIQRMLGESSRPEATAAEQKAIADVEREIAREYPFYFDEERLSELHERYGRWQTLKKPG